MKEKFILQTVGVSTGERKYPILWHHNDQGYPYSCSVCGEGATWRLEIQDHLFQPQGSLYYCESHVPEHKIPTHD